MSPFSHNFLHNYSCIILSQVAVKHMKRSFPTWQECTELRELKSLMKLSQHENIVQLYEVIRERDEQLYFVFEYMPDGNLYEFIKKCTMPVTASSKHPINLLTGMRIQSILNQILQGIAHLHQNGYIHRDIKPENILCHGDKIKVADFGLARECSNNHETFTEYVSTRWYRAPEILLQSKHDGKPVDLFAVGCITFELFSHIPLFPGENEIDQLHKLCEVLGSPTSSTWPYGLELASKIGFCFPQSPAKSVRATLEKRVNANPNKIPSAAIQLMKDLLEWNPEQRPTVEEALNSVFFFSHPESTILVPEHERIQTVFPSSTDSTLCLSTASFSSMSAAPKIKIPSIGEYSSGKRSREELYFSPRSITQECSQSTHTSEQYFEVDEFFVSPFTTTVAPFTPFSSTKKPRQLFSDDRAIHNLPY